MNTTSVCKKQDQQRQQKFAFTIHWRNKNNTPSNTFFTTTKILNVTYKKYQIWLLSNKSPASMCDKVYYMSVCGWACLPSRSLLRVTHKSKNPLSVPQPTTNYNLTKETFQGLNGLSSTKYIYGMILSILFCIFHLFWVRNVLTFYQLCIYVIAWLCLAAAIP